jgi:hypothetical protein
MGRFDMKAKHRAQLLEGLFSESIHANSFQAAVSSSKVRGSAVIIRG